MADRNDLPTPVTAQEKFAAKAAGMSVDVPTPVTRMEQYMNAISGGGTPTDTYTKTEIDTLLAAKADKSDTYTKSQVDSGLAGKLDKADVDSAPTEDSTNPVESGGVYTALAGMTQLEQIDRNALVEIIDSGAKNRIPTHTPETVTSDTAVVTYNADGSITAERTTATTTGTAYDIAENGITLPAGDYVLSSGVIMPYNCTITLYHADGTHTLLNPQVGNSYVQFTITTTNQIRRIYLWLSASVTAETKFYPMICSKSEWDVSHSYQQHFYPVKCVYAQHKPVACSTTLTTTGLQFTATESGLYRVTVVALQTSAMPTGISIKQKVSASSTQYTLTSKENAKPYTGISDVATLNVEAGGGFELFVSYETATNNQVGMIVEKIG